MPPRRSKGPKIALIVAIAVVLVAVVAFLAIGPIVSGRVRAAAQKRALDIDYAGVAYRFTHAELSDVRIRPRGSTRLQLRAPVLDARISGFSPTWVILPRGDLQIAGGFDDVVRAIGPVRDADEALPLAERLPVDVQAGTLKWTAPFGEGTSISFGAMTALLRPKEHVTKVTLGKGVIELPSMKLSAVTADLTRNTTNGEKLDLRAHVEGEEGHAELDAHRHDGDVDVELALESLGIGTATPKVTGLDLSQATIDGSASAEWKSDAKLSSKGKLTFAKLRLPPVKVGPIALSIGGSVRVTWKGSPKKGAPGTMTLDDAKVEVTLGGKTRVVKVRGDVAIGEAGEGPYTVKLDWEAGPFACSEIAGDLAGPLAKGLAASAVSGNVNVRGTIRGDVTELDDLQKSLEILEACKIDVGKGVGGLLKDLPW